MILVLMLIGLRCMYANIHIQMMVAVLSSGLGGTYIDLGFYIT